MVKALDEYNRKRNFDVTTEPQGDYNSTEPKALTFVVQKHAARALHYDFRLEFSGTLKSWAVPKGPSLDPSIKRLAVQVEDHPLSYAGFEGTIPQGQYGAGRVIVWDKGTWQPDTDPRKALQTGKLTFRVYGEKLTGRWHLVRTHRKNTKQQQWLLFKDNDSAAREAKEYDITDQRPESVLSGETIGKPTHSSSGDKRKIKTSPDSKTSASSKKNTSLPAALLPQLATLASKPPPGSWLYELKFDGYRILARIISSDVRLFTRNGNDWTAKLPEQAAALAKLGLTDSWLDGELVALNADGHTDFQALQNAFDKAQSKNLVYYLFDAPFLNGIDLRKQTLEHRRAALKNALSPGNKGIIRYSDSMTGDSSEIYAKACAMSLEGLIGKRSGSLYVSKRSPDWIKLKCLLRQEFVIAGYTDPKGSRSGFGALLLAVHDKQGGALRYAGRVGTGFNHEQLNTLSARLQKLTQSGSALSDIKTVPQANTVHWVKPTLVCEVEFGQWTKQHLVRHAVFLALRDDKPAAEIIREQATLPDKSEGNPTVAAKSQPTSSRTGTRRSATTVAELRVSHGKRIIDASSGATKLQLAQFYQAIAPWILPYLNNRPVSLLRAPRGVDEKQFFQKHSNHLNIPNIKQLDQALDPGHARLMEIDTVKALVGAVQMGTIEFHTWGATTNHIEKPDQLVLDLDPDPNLPWQKVIEATQLTLSVLDELELVSYLKTSGGKGMHIIVPLARYHSWEQVKTFAKLISQFMATKIPARFVDKMGPKNRIDKIFIDYLRNQRGASTVAAYSVRARPNLPVSVPIRRDELSQLQSSAQWHIGNLQQRLAELTASPWHGYNNQQRIRRALWQRLGGEPPE